MEHIKSEVIHKMIEMGFENDVIETNLENKKHNNITTTYELFVKKYIKNENYKTKIGSPVKLIANMSAEKKYKPPQISYNLGSGVKDTPKINKSNNKDSNATENKNININIINYDANKIGNININISNNVSYYHQIVPPSGGKYY